MSHRPKILLVLLLAAFTVCVANTKKVQAAAPLAHIVVAERLLNCGALQVTNRDEFLRGTSFNDIRYIGVVPREGTHRSQVSWNDVVAEQDSFHKGMLLHSLLDIVRERYIEQGNIYTLVPEYLFNFIPLRRFKTQIVKFAEDSLLQKTAAPRDEDIERIFSIISEGEREFVNNDESIKRWHEMLKGYLKTSSTHLRTCEFMKVLAGYWKGTLLNNIGFTRELSNTVDSLAANDEFSNQLLEFYDNPERYLNPAPDTQAQLQTDGRPSHPIANSDSAAGPAISDS